ncbi:hypothetical protein Lfu02_37660 [Longispora fulva]|nr:hypothetical protein Lfu02_37660 [Longispora fulva]
MSLPAQRQLETLTDGRVVFDQQDPGHGIHYRTPPGPIEVSNGRVPIDTLVTPRDRSPGTSPIPPAWRPIFPAASPECHGSVTARRTTGAPLPEPCLRSNA